MKKMNFPVGQKVRGYGILNEYGEFDFIPQQVGIRQGQVNIVKSCDEYTVSESKQCVMIRAKFKKTGKKLDDLKTFFNIINQIITIIKEYDF